MQSNSIPCRALIPKHYAIFGAITKKLKKINMNSVEDIITKTGMFYPTGFVVGLIMPPTDPNTAGQPLRDAGFADVRVFTSQEILADVQRIEGKQSFFDRLANSLSEEGTPREMYLERIRQGGAMVLVRAHTDAQVDQAHTLLKASGGQGMAYYGLGTIKELL